MNCLHVKYHFIGIGGIGMSALARILLEKQIRVTGSDLSLNKRIDGLKKKGALIQQQHSPENIPSRDTVVVYSSGIKQSNPEFQAALALKCPLLHRSELLAYLMKGYQTLAVAGTHGKTTTSALLISVLCEGGLDPTFAIGGEINAFDCNGRLGKGNYFVAEADESDGSFLNYHPAAAIVTNIEPEHMDHYKTEEALHTAFQTFLSQVRYPERLFYCGDDFTLNQLVNGKGISYGFNSRCRLRLTHFRQEKWHLFFDLVFDGKNYSDIEVALIGEHNALNAAAAFGLALCLGVEEAKIRKAFKTFPGVKRRCDKRGEVHEVLFIDDYAHHPTEITKTLKAVKKAVEERRLIVVFQPHRYSRTYRHLQEYGKAFDAADLVYVTDIYAAREEKKEKIAADHVVEIIRQLSTVPTAYLSRDQLVETLQGSLKPHDILLTLGAGDITELPSELIRSVAPKLRVGLIFGGRSCEHEISLLSARFVAHCLNQNLYEICFFGIDKEGNWVTGAEAQKLLEEADAVASANSRSILDPAIGEPLSACDLFLPILHGTYGEDGIIQGFFEMLGKPYIGPDFRSAALATDKVLTKRLVAASCVPTPKDISFSYPQWATNREVLLNEIQSTFAFPLYVKPVHLGSSVGVSKVEEEKQLIKAIETAFCYDAQIMIEEGKIGCRELEFPVIGNTHAVRVASPGEKLAKGEFVDYEKKYGNNPVQTTLYPELDPVLEKQGCFLAKRAYKAVGASGMMRVDFLLDENQKFWFFEMNPIPGLQKYSLFPKIWKREGISNEGLFDRLIILALHRKRQQDRHCAS